MTSLDEILDETLDAIATRKESRHQGPRFQLTVSDAPPKGYVIIVELYGEAIVEAFGGSLASAKQKAIDLLRAHVADSADEIANALELSIEEARDL